jgi:hypothetical protein
LTRVADPRQDGPARALRRGFRGELSRLRSTCSLGARAPSGAGCGREAARVRWLASPGILRLGGRRSPSGRAGLASRPPIGSRLQLFRPSSSSVRGSIFWVGSGRLADNGGWRQPRGDRGRSGPACARSRKERRFRQRRVGGQATLASASPPDATRPGWRGSPAASPAQPAALLITRPVHRVPPLERQKDESVADPALNESGLQAAVSSFGSYATTRRRAERGGCVRALSAR